MRPPEIPGPIRPLVVRGTVALLSGAAWTGVWLYGRNKRERTSPRAALGPRGLGMALTGSF